MSVMNDQKFREFWDPNEGRAPDPDEQTSFLFVDEMDRELRELIFTNKADWTAAIWALEQAAKKLREDHSQHLRDLEDHWARQHGGFTG
jgi:hypothetical protein